MTSQTPLKAAAALFLAVLLPATVRHAPAAFAQSATADDGLAVLRGRVVAGDASARPLPGARVTVVGSERNSAVVSDREGRFETRVPARGNWSLHVTKAGFAPAQLTNATADEAAIIRMTPGAAAIGRVVDQRGDPVPGAVVRLRPADCATPCPVDLPAVAALVGQTDDLGEFRIGSLPSGRYEVSISRGSAVLPSGVDAAASVSMEAYAAWFRRLRSVAGDVAPSAAADRAESLPPEFVDLRPGEETVIYHVLDTTPAPGGGAPSGSAGTQRGATIAGRITGPSGRPIDGARVQVIHSEGESQTTVTDADGRYAVTGLDAGSFRLQVTNAGFPPVQYGQQHSQQQGTPIVVRGRETVSGIDVQLPRGGVISGRVVDVHGEPIEGLNVQVWQRQFTAGRTALVAPGGVRADRTDDRGQYRIYGLLPGTYYIVASEHSTVVSSMRTTSASGSEAAALAERYRAALGGRGNVEVSVRPDGQISVNLRASSPPSLTQSRVFHPGSVAPEQALAVRIEPGLDGHGADIVFAPPPAARVSGVALDSSGQPAEGAVTLAVSRRSGALALPARAASIASDGTFEFLDVPPGDYVLQVQARSMAPTASPVQGSGAPTAPRRNPNSGEPEFGMQYVTVSSAADAEVSIRTAPFSYLTARVIAEGGGSSVSREGFVFGAVAAHLDRSPPSMRPEAALREDWTFALGSLTGPLRLELRRAPPGWYLKSAHIAGIDAAEFPVTLPAADPATRWAPTRSSGNVADIVVARAGEISGRALSERGEPATDYAVVVFPVDPARWYDRSRYLKMTRTIRDGTFAVTGLPPGEYWVAAVDRILGDDAGGEWQRPEVLSSLTTGASRIRVAEGQQVATDLRLIRMSW